MKDRALVIALAVAIPLFSLAYVGSYLSIVVPGIDEIDQSRYRLGGKYSEFLFYPIETIDRQLRPKAWQFPLFVADE